MRTANSPNSSSKIFPLAIAFAVLAIFLILAWQWRKNLSDEPGVDQKANQTVQSDEQSGKKPEPTDAKNPSSMDGNEPASSKRIKLEKKLKLVNFSHQETTSAQRSDEQLVALDKLNKTIPGISVDFDPITGSPSNMVATGKFLSGPSKDGSDANASIKEFLDANAGLFGQGSNALEQTRVTREDVTAHNGMRTVVWQQEIDGIPVYNTILKGNVTKDGALITLGSHFMQDPIAATQMPATRRAALIAQPPVEVGKAVSLAADNLGDKVTEAQARATSDPQGTERKQKFSAPGLSDTVAQLSWLPIDSKTARLTWDVTLMSLKQNEMFRVLVDVQTGEVLMRTSLTNDATDASFRVYADAITKKPFDSPNPMLPGTSTPSGAQAVEVPRQLVTLQSVNPIASPNGWINDGIFETIGNNVDAHTDTNADNIADLPRPTSATRVFDFAMDTTQAPSTYKDAAVTHLFYMNNWMHDQLYSLGFTESAGNFQTNNFGRGGNGNDAVQADAQDGNGTNNANMSTPSDGSAPRMQMYVFTGPTPARDGDFDDVVVLHEYTHGLSNRLVGGGVGISANATGGMGEGWSDFYGLSLMADPASDPNAVYPGGSYATLNFVTGMTSNYYFGIRRYPYSTDMTKNPLTFRDIDPTQASPHTGIPLSPLFSSSNSSPSEVHNVGEVWCMTLWECRAKLITKYGASGNQMMLQITTDGMKLSPANPNLLQARDAIIQADLVDNAGANYVELWAAFAKRGMGASATAPASSTTTGVVEAFDLPDPLSIAPGTVVTAAGPVGGPFTPSVQTYTLTNTGSLAPLTWTAAAGSPWISVSPASGTLAAGASTTVTMTFNSKANALVQGSYTGSVIFTDTTSGVALTRSTTLTVGVTDYYTELFSGANDTDNQSWLFTPNGSSSYYSVLRTASVTSFPTDPTGGTSLVLSDDSFLPVTPTGGATVKLYGTTYATFYVGSNGYITFGSGDTVYSESLSAHFSTPRISALFDDLNPGSTGTISWRQLADRIAVTFQNVPEYSSTNSNNFQIEMFFDGRIRITCLAIAATDGLIGLSQGLGTPVNFVSSDFSSYGSGGGSGGAATLSIAVPATVTEGSGVLVGQGSVSLSATQATDTVVTLVSTNTAKVTVPATVTILGGQLSTTFDVTVLEDAIVDGTQTAIITATATGFPATAGVISVLDNDGTATLTLTAPASATEGVGSVQGTVTMSTVASAPVVVSLTSSDTTAAQVPATVVIPAGQTSAAFAITIVNDTNIDGTQVATLIGHVGGWTDGTAVINVLDNENTNLAVSLPTSVTEGGTGTGTVTITGTLPNALTVSLSSDTTSRLTVPAAVTIAAGATSASFTLTAPNNTVTDGNATVTIAASAAGFTNGTATTTVLDNDVHHYVWNTIASPQTRGSPFSVTITAKDVNNVTIASYTGTPGITAAGTSGADVVTPSTTTAFVAGVWTGNVTVDTFDTNVVLTVNDGAGHTGGSNAFNVGIGAVHHFAWNTQAVRARGAAVSATVTAQDAGNNTATTFVGTANLSGYVNVPVSAPANSIVITEINTNTPDEIEFMNVGTAAVDISGWKIYIYDNTTFGTSSILFTVPAGTTCAAGQIFRLQEYGTSPGTFPQFYTGANINWNPGSTDYVGVLVRDAANNNVDFLCAAALAASAVTSPVTIPTSMWTGAQLSAPTNTLYDYVRTGSSDSNSAANWTTAAANMGTVNVGLTAPFVGPSSVSISPTITGAFSSGVWTGAMTVLQTASLMKFRADDGSGHLGDSNSFDVTGTMTLSLPTSAVEGATGVTGTLTVSSAPANNLTVALSSSDTNSLTVPATVTIPAGQTSVTIPITIIDDTIVNGTRVVAVTASISNWTNATANISVLDNETTSLAIFLPSTVTEGTTATATVSSSNTPVSALTVSLVSNNTSRLTVPATVTIPSGSSSVTFNVTVVENTLTDGRATVNVTASASGYTGTNANTTVQDNDVHHFSIATVASPQTRGVPFNVTITAFDVGNAVLASFAGTPGLTASGTGGTNSISPANASGFVNGVWTGQVTSFSADSNVILIVSDGAGHTGTSNAFTVSPPLFSPTVLEEVTPTNLLSGNNPKAQLVVGADGAFYGTTQFGGSSNQGAVFKVTSAGVMTTLANFYGANGAQPWSGLVLASDGNFYGTTSAGGSNNLGTIFKMTPTGTLTTLVHLSTTTGSAPKAPLLQASDGNFYGTTSSGGSSSSGTIFKMTSSGVLTVLVNFTGTISTAYGSSCQAGLIQASDTNLYGVTSTGGSGGGFGSVFKVTTGGAFTSLTSFTGTTGAALGSAPLAALVQASDGNLYGTTSAGGTGGFGTIFKVTTAGVLTNLLSFTGTTGVNVGTSPQSALVQWTDGNLYGTTNTGGTTGDLGTIFKVTTAGTLTTLRNMTSTTDGSNPYGALVLGGNGNFYGAATSGGTLSKGTIFNIAPSTSTFTNVFNFVTSPPVYKRLMLANDGNFYGVTQFGNAGANSVFKLTPAGTLSTLTTFASTSTVAPFLIQGIDGNLYGAEPNESTYGQIFSLTTGGIKTTLATMTGSGGSFPGSSIVGGILQGSDGSIYGTTSSGGFGVGYGTAWKITTDGTFTSLASFTGNTGATSGSLPQTRLVEGGDGNFYGTTSTGGASGLGTVFRVSPAGGITTLVQFTGTTGAALGSSPNTNLLFANDGNFYGTTTGGARAALERFSR